MTPVDLDRVTGNLSVEADVCVIGAGPVGLTIARRLTELGVRVVLLERGGVSAQPQAQSPEVAFDGRNYGAAHAGRAFGYGGTSTLWGGQLLPATASELSAVDTRGLVWPIGAADLKPHYLALDRWLGVDSSPFEITGDVNHPLSRLDWLEFAPRLSKWLAFRRRNIAHAWRPVLDAAAALQIFVNARVTSFERDGRTLRRVVARSRQAHLVVATGTVVIAAGAIESTRIALSMFEEPDLRVARPFSLGRYLHDHLSVRLGTLRPVQPGNFQRLFAPAFLAGTMRTLRVELNVQSAQAHGLPPAYAHIVAAAVASSGFALVRDLLRALQGGRIGDGVRLIYRIPAALPEILRLLWWRAARDRLVFPSGAALHVQLDFQQEPAAQNRIYLGTDLDEHGCRKVRIDWNLLENSRPYLAAYQQHLLKFWQRNALQGVAELSLIDIASESALDPTNIYDIYHPAGTTRMADRVADGCVDSNLKVFGMNNLYIAGSSVFPKLGAANPTYTAMALGMRLAGHLARGSTSRAMQ